RLEGVVELALGIESPGCRDLPLDIDLLRPVGVLRLAQLVAQLGKLGDIRLGGLRIAGARGAQCACEMAYRLHMGEGTRPDLQLGCALPVTSLDRVARGRGCERVCGGESVRSDARDGIHLLDHLSRLAVLPQL